MKYINIKKYYFLFFCFIIFSCNDEIKNRESNIEKTLNTDNFQYEKLQNKILGTWQIVSSEDDAFVTTYNVCPQATFYSNGTAKIITPSLETENYTWKINVDTLSFLFNNESKVVDSANRYFDDQYIVRFEQNTEYYEMKIKNSHKNHVYILRK